METYILRIYRRADVPQAVHGTLERVGVRQRAAFATRDELWALLVAPPQPEELSEPPGADEGEG
jgi:hypothetical protein